jgi:hypothetical protein
LEARFWRARTAFHGKLILYIIFLFGCRLSLRAYRFIFATDICVEGGRREKWIDGNENRRAINN